MDLALVMSRLRPGENVSPDLSTYNEMVIHWRGQGVPPSLAEVEADWNLVKTEVDEINYQIMISKKLLEAGVTSDAKIEALWEKTVKNSPEAADALLVAEEKVMTDFPKPV